VLITPRLVRALDPDEVPPLPTRFKPFLGGVGGDDESGNDFQGTGPVDAPAPDASKGDAARKKQGGR
jgi:hypothetical protein